MASSSMEADALWVNGEHAQPARHHLVRIPSPRPNEAATLLSVKDIDRPVAFSLPLGNGYLTPAEVFNPRSAQSIAEVLQSFESRLRPLANQLLVAQQVAARRYELSSPVYHLCRAGTVVAVVDILGSVGIDPGAMPADLAGAVWQGRPAAAGVSPPHFIQLPLPVLMWQYVMRCDEDLLPDKYRKGMIFYRRAPYVPRRLLKDVHLALLAELSPGPQTFAQLQQEIGLGDRALAQALGALYYAGSITTDASRAATLHTRVHHPEEEPSNPSMGSAFNALPPVAPLRRRRQNTATVPTPLEQPGRSHDG